MKQKGFILIPLVLVGLIIVTIGIFLFKPWETIPKTSSNPILKTDTKQAIYYSKNKTISFEYPSDLFTIDEFNDTPQTLYDSLISDILLFYKTKEDATSNQECVFQETKTSKCEGENAECYSKCDNKWILKISIARHKKGSISGIKQLYESNPSNYENKYFNYTDESKRSWVVIERNFNLNWPNSYVNSTVEVNSSRANLETQNFLYEIDIDSVSGKIEHNSVRNKILSTFNFIE